MVDSAKPKEQAPATIGVGATNLFRLEMAVLVTLKIILLLTIKTLWFDHPEARHMRVPDVRVEQHFFGDPAPTRAPNPMPPPGDDHARPR